MPPSLAGGVLLDPLTRTYGTADLLVRSDELLRLFPNVMTDDEAAFVAEALAHSRGHYRVVSVEYHDSRTSQEWNH